MKTLFIGTEKSALRHENEEYDEILWVKDDISTQNIQSYIPRIKDAIRLTNSHHKPDEEDKKVYVYIDAPSPFYWICQNLQMEMENNEKINVVFPQINENTKEDEYTNE